MEEKGEKMENHHSKTFLTILVSVVLTALIVGGSIIYYSGKQIAVSDKATSDKIATLESQIKLLNDAKTKPAVKAPVVTPVEDVAMTDWKTYENTKDGYSYKYPPLWTNGVPNWFKNTNPAYGVLAESNKTLQETINYYTSSDQVFASAPFYKKTDTIFAGQEATQISYGYKGDDEIRIIIFQYKNNIFTVTGYPKESLEQNGPKVNTFDLISSTFQFIK